MAGGVTDDGPTRETPRYDGEEIARKKMSDQEEETVAEYPRQSVMPKPADIPTAVRLFQQSLLAKGWEPRPNGEFSKAGVWIGFTWTMGNVRCSVWKRPEGGVSQDRAIRDFPKTADPYEVEMLLPMLEQAIDLETWPPEGFRDVNRGYVEKVAAMEWPEEDR
jgi:hypothetical protein